MADIETITEQMRQRAGWDPLEDRLDPERVAEFDAWLLSFANDKWEEGAVAEFNAGHSPTDPRPRNPYAKQAILFPRGDFIASKLTDFLASADGTPHGYAWGPETSVVFRREGGEVEVRPGQWIVKHPDGRVTVEDERPSDA